MDYIDDLFREYLLFRGFTETLQSFTRERLSPKGSFSWQADAICKSVFARLIPQHDFEGLVDLLRFLRLQVFSKLYSDLEEQATKLEVNTEKQEKEWHEACIMHIWMSKGCHAFRRGNPYASLLFPSICPCGAHHIACIIRHQNQPFSCLAHGYAVSNTARLAGISAPPMLGACN